MLSIDNSQDKKNIDLSLYTANAEEHEYVDNLSGITENDALEFVKVGIETKDSLRSGTFIQKDNSLIHCSKSSKGVDLRPIAKALKEFPWLDQYMWTLLDRKKDNIGETCNNDSIEGFFIRVQKGVKVEKPLQTCLHIAKDKFSQNVHNIVIVEEDSEINIITGCSTSSHINSGLHIGLSEFFVKKGATLKYTMIHDWGENITVRPKTKVHVEEGGLFVSNYISLRPVGSIEANPVTYLDKDATALFNSILVAGKDSYMDMGSIVELNGPGARTEIISRAIAAGGTIISRGHIKGNVPGVKGHLECKGLILKDGLLHAIPELSAHTPDVEMSHEAAVGKIDKREIEYLMARGLDEDEAVSTIVRGFLNVDIEGLPEELTEKMNQAVFETQQDVM
ncbi:MAG: SufD family Fe-S cluster assembly protein [Thermodesulfobacteriota bacterium]|nr:SufD family Fe-S cluster assembly protein [Thermodesulfobacteriota bacterium]